MKTWLLRGVLAVLLAAALLAIGGAASAIHRLPDLEPWHVLLSRLEPRAAEITSTFTIEDYLKREEAVFREARERVDAVVSPAANAAVPNRYVTGSRSYPDKLGVNWNRTQILEAADLRGGALLIHGLTDSPYSMRALAARLNARGYYTLSLRMQGHGTVPGGLVTATWEDWAAAVRMGARHVRKVVGADRPLVLVGYSNGGALVTKYTLDALEDATLPAPASLILVSPMIGVSPAARLARFISMLGPVVDKARWIDVVPEYNPFRVQLVSRERGHADVPAHARAWQPADAGAAGRPASAHAAGAGVPVCCRHDGEHASRRVRLARSPARGTERARPVRSEPACGR